jgi:hypothetical protein
MKEEANKDFSEKNYTEALNKYISCISLAEKIDLTEQLAKLYFNKGLCLSRLVK